MSVVAPLPNAQMCRSWAVWFRRMSGLVKCRSAVELSTQASVPLAAITGWLSSAGL
jgi:hypothetical protein